MTTTTTTTDPTTALANGAGKRIHTAALAHGWSHDGVAVRAEYDTVVSTYRLGDIRLDVHVGYSGVYLTTEMHRETPNALYTIGLLARTAHVLDVIDEQAADRDAR